jgi:hypothetical protein
MEKEGGMMKYLLVILLSFSLVGCAKPLTRLLPKLEKMDPPAELMVPPQELKIIEKPVAPQAELERDVPPQR